MSGTQLSNDTVTCLRPAALAEHLHAFLNDR